MVSLRNSLTAILVSTTLISCGASNHTTVKKTINPEKRAEFEREANQYLSNFLKNSEGTGVTEVTVDDSGWLVIMWDERRWESMSLSDRYALMRLVGANWQMIHKATIGDDGWVKVVGSKTWKLLASAKGSAVVIKRD